LTIPSVAPLGRIVSPAEVPPIDLSRTFAVGQSLLGTVVRIVPHGGVLVNFNDQHVLLPLGQQLVPGQTLVATVVQVSPTLMLQLADDPALSVPAEVLLTLSQVPQEEQQGVLTASQLKEYLAASQPFGQTVTMLEELLITHPLLHDIAPALTQALQDTLTVLRPQGDAPPDATQLQEQVDRSGINYESKVQRLLTGESSNITAELAKDLKGQLLELSHRLEQLAHTGTDTRSRVATTVLEQVKRAVHALEFQQLSNQFALQEHHPLVLPLVHPLTPPTPTTHLSIHRDGGKEGRPSAEQERYTVALSLDLTALGPLYIEATVHGSEVSATLQVEDPVVAEFLRVATPELCARLQALGLQAHVICDVQEHVAREAAEPLPHSLTRAMRLVDIKI
jgi:Flagellar hook-length control protein FliK